MIEKRERTSNRKISRSAKGGSDNNRTYEKKGFGRDRGSKMLKRRVGDDTAEISAQPPGKKGDKRQSSFLKRLEGVVIE